MSNAITRLRKTKLGIKMKQRQSSIIGELIGQALKHQGWKMIKNRVATSRKAVENPFEVDPYFIDKASKSAKTKAFIVGAGAAITGVLIASILLKKK